MARMHASSAEVVHIGPLGGALAGSRTSAILKAEQLEIVRIVLAAGKHLREHHAPGELTLHCLEGEIDLRVCDTPQRLRAGDWIHLRRGEPHSLHALSDASLLLTLCIVPA